MAQITELEAKLGVTTAPGAPQPVVAAPPPPPPPPMPPGVHETVLEGPPGEQAIPKKATLPAHVVAAFDKAAAMQDSGTGVPAHLDPGDGSAMSGTGQTVGGPAAAGGVQSSDSYASMMGGAVAAPAPVAPPVAAPPPPPPPVEVAPAPAPAPEPARAQLHPWERKPLIPVRMKANKTTPASRPGTAPPASNVPVKSAPKPTGNSVSAANGASSVAKALAAAEKARSLQAERDAASKALAAASKARREAFEAQRKLGAPPKPGAAWEQGPRKSPRKLPHHKSPVKGKADAAAARWARAEGYLAQGNAQKQAVMTNARWRN